MIRYGFTVLFAHYRNHWQIPSEEQLEEYSAFSEKFTFEGY